MSFTEEFDRLKIQLEDIVLATDNFHHNKLIGRGGFGSVYKGDLSLPEGLVVVAFKRLNHNLGQGNVEFWKEITMLSKYKHENLVTLLRFCNEGDERILVYEYASRGSLDHHLSDISLTWIQRLKICIGVANALNYLHDPGEKHRRVIHRDVKSSNILLDENWRAKVSDFGLSKIGPANQSQTYILSNAVGTLGYGDPLYWETGFLSKESDVYSFGVVLLEVMCGKLCYEYSEGMNRILVNMWKECCDEGRLEAIMIDGMKEEMDRDSLMVFSAIANRCLSRKSRERPTMMEIIKELELALEKEETKEVDTNWEEKFSNDYMNLMRLSNDAIQWTTKKEAYLRLRHGFFIDKHDKWFSITKRMKKRIMIPAKAFLSNYRWTWKSLQESRFEVVAESRVERNFGAKCRIKSQSLSPQTTYTCHLIYKLPDNCYSVVSIVEVCNMSLCKMFSPWYIYLGSPCTPIIVRDADGTSHIPSYTRKIEGHPKLRKDGWMECQFWKVTTTSNGTINLNLAFENLIVTRQVFVRLVVQGIEFREV